MPRGQKLEPALACRLSNRTEAILSKRGATIILGLNAFSLTATELRNLADAEREFESMQEDGRNGAQQAGSAAARGADARSDPENV